MGARPLTVLPAGVHHSPRRTTPKEPSPSFSKSDRSRSRIRQVSECWPPVSGGGGVGGLRKVLWGWGGSSESGRLPLNTCGAQRGVGWGARRHAGGTPNLPARWWARLASVSPSHKGDIGRDGVRPSPGAQLGMLAPARGPGQACGRGGRWHFSAQLEAESPSIKSPSRPRLGPDESRKGEATTQRPAGEHTGVLGARGARGAAPPWGTSPGAHRGVPCLGAAGHWGGQGDGERGCCPRSRLRLCY